jgi:hypothetical protein
VGHGGGGGGLLGRGGQNSSCKDERIRTTHMAFLAPTVHRNDIIMERYVKCFPLPTSSNLNITLYIML